MTFGFTAGFATARETFVNSLPSPEKFVFSKYQIESIERVNLVPRLSMVVTRFRSFIEDFVICCNKITKFLCPRYCFTRSLSAKIPCDLGSLADLTILLFSEVSLNTMLPRCHFERTFRI